MRRRWGTQRVKRTTALRLDFDRRLLLQFRGSSITSDAGLLAYRELDDTLDLTDTGAETLADARTGKNGRHRLAGLLRQSVFGRLAGYKDVNDAERLCRDPAIRWVVGDRAIAGSAASASQMGRFETKWLCRPENLTALADLSSGLTRRKGVALALPRFSNASRRSWPPWRWPTRWRAPLGS